MKIVKVIFLNLLKVLITIGKPFYKLLGLFLIKESRYVIAGFILLGLVGATVWFKNEILADLPDINKIYIPPRLSSRILDRDGNLLYKFYEDENRTWITIDQVPLSLIWATIAVEDKNFFDHHGVSFKGLIQAVWYNFKKTESDKPRGGSTITQQLTKNVFLSNEKTYKRKAKELILSILLEWKLDKLQILERYFNQVAYGGETYGAQEAALKYFGKNVWEINMAEAAFLAGLPAAPSSYSPFGENSQYAFARQRHVIDEMEQAGFISKEKAEELKNEKVTLKEDKKFIRSPHFVFYVKEKLSQMGLGNFETQGLTIKTTIDSKIQDMAERIVKEEVDKVRSLRISNGAAMITSPTTGDILAMVGSKDYYAKDIDGKYNVTTSLRQPGSSIKPINYLVALENGKTLMSYVDDTPVSYPIKGQKPYTPQNYNGKHMGKVSVKTALASSLNIPSVKLLNEFGVDKMINKAEQMGITTWKDRSRFGLSLALGAGEVKMEEMTTAYGSFANGGEKVDVNPITEIYDYKNNLIYKREIIKERVISEGNAFLINTALSDDKARAPVFGLNSKLHIPGKTIAVKTGTTNSLKDNWCIGWTPSVVVSTWVGNNDASPMSWVASGVSGATPIWNRIMQEMLKEKGEENWKMPESVIKASMCGKEEYFIRGTENQVKCPISITPTPGEDFSWWD